MERFYDVEGTTVRCVEHDGNRLWHCKCEAFDRTLKKFSEGFCPHTAVAIWRFHTGDLGEESSVGSQ